MVNLKNVFNHGFADHRVFFLWCCWSGGAKVITSKLKRFIKSKWFVNKQWVRLNYATTHHDPPRPTTIHHYPPLAKIYLPAPTTSHHQPKHIYHHPLPPTTCQNTSTTTQHQPKYIHHHPPFPKKWTTTTQKPKYIHIKSPFGIALKVSFSWKCNIAFHQGDSVWQSFDQLVFQVPNFYLHSEATTGGVL